MHELSTDFERLAKLAKRKREGSQREDTDGADGIGGEEVDGSIDGTIKGNPCTTCCDEAGFSSQPNN